MHIATQHHQSGRQLGKAGHQLQGQSHVGQRANADQGDIRVLLEQRNEGQGRVLVLHVGLEVLREYLED
jgi:hypothetical protein